MKRSKNGCPSPNRFDPFSDRCSRDIRNRFSTSFVDSIQRMNPDYFEQTAQDILKAHPKDVYKNYVLGQLELYRKAYQQVAENKITTAEEQVPILWNNHLFFEVHELLEGFWQTTEGRLHQGLKGLIQAAGVYVHLKQKNYPAAINLAKRASIHLKESVDCLTFLKGVTELIKKLEQLDSVPPHLDFCQSS